MKPIDAALEEVQQTVDDLKATMPGLGVVILLVVPTGNDADIKFVTNLDTDFAIKTMGHVLDAHKESEVTEDTPEAS